MFNNSNFMAVKKRLQCEWGGIEPPQIPPLAMPLLWSSALLLSYN